MKKEKYYGIYFNDNIPKLDKVNKYRKEVEIKFNGQAYLIKRDDNEEIIEREQLKNKYKLKKEDKYEIEFINSKNECYYLKIEIGMSYLFILLLLFLVGFMIGLLLCRPNFSDNSLINNFYDFIDLKVLQLDIDKESEEKIYNFDVDFNHISSTDINLTDTISANTVVKNKIAPRCKR